MLVNEEGVPIFPTKYKINKAGFIIHSSIHKARPDINAACHVHSVYGRTWSAFGKPVEMLNQGRNFGLCDDASSFALLLSPKLSEKIKYEY